MSKHVLMLLPILAAALASARENPQHWLELRAPRFTIITNSSAKECRHIAAHFERMRAVFEKAYPQLEADLESPIVVLAVKGKKNFQILEPATYHSKGRLRLHGLFVGASDQNYILMDLDADGGRPYPLVYHEYTHVILSEAQEKMPLWLNEGLAEFYEKTEIYNQEVLLGEPYEQRLKLLLEEKLVPLSTLFMIDEGSPYYLEEKKASVFYAECWALTHFLMLKDYAEKTTKVQQYADLVDDGVDPVTAAANVFGDLKQLQKKLERYIEQGSLKHFETTTITEIDESKFHVDSISPIEVETVEADFLASDGRTEEARLHLQEILRRDPENASAKDMISRIQSAAEVRPEKTQVVNAGPVERGPDASSSKTIAPKTPEDNDLPAGAGVAILSTPEARPDVETVPNEPHRFVVGILQAVHCEPPSLDLIVTSGSKAIALHADNYYKIRFTALFTPTKDLEPCIEIENRPAKVEYVELSGDSTVARLLAVELHK